MNRGDGPLLTLRTLIWWLSLLASAATARAAWSSAGSTLSVILGLVATATTAAALDALTRGGGTGGGGTTGGASPDAYAYLHGVSTRIVDDLVQALGVASGISKSEVSRICADLTRAVNGPADGSLAWRRLSGRARSTAGPATPLLRMR